MSERPEAFHRISENAFEVIERPVGAWERIYGNAGFRKAVLLLVLAATWRYPRGGFTIRSSFPRCWKH